MEQRDQPGAVVSSEGLGAPRYKLDVEIENDDCWPGRAPHRAVLLGDVSENYSADAERFRWLAEHTVATGLARWVHPFQFLAEAVDARRNEATTNAAPRVTTAAELRQQAKSDTSCVGAFARARPGKA